ncbi:MAG TPA: DUF5615 family PIN-like protein [Ktedonobacterales bacterium]|nr:DUF5615 family PIN-like protein [Ktedonobacterales bacterium]
MAASITPYSSNPPRLLADANFNEHIVRGLRRLRSDIHIVTAHQAGLDGVPDPEVLAYAARHDLILLTHDVRTMPGHFADFLQSLSEGEYSPGIWYTAQTLSVGVAIQAILETWLCSGHEEYRNRELRLP